MSSIWPRTTLRRACPWAGAALASLNACYACLRCRHRRNTGARPRSRAVLPPWGIAASQAVCFLLAAPNALTCVMGWVLRCGLMSDDEGYQQAGHSGHAPVRLPACMAGVLCTACPATLPG